jgi:hypothetical protein
MPVELGAPVRAKLDKLYLDPNNPRLALAERPGYSKPSLFLSESLQDKLTDRLRESYKGLKDLVRSILSVGWLPVDPMLVWEMPRKKGHYVVLEGNTRVTALRLIRRDHEREKRRLAKFKQNPFLDAAAVREQEEKTSRYTAVVRTTDSIEVWPVAAESAADLAQAVPRLLGVRHITHAQQWKPHATNFYVATIYRQLFDEAYGPAQALRLEEPLLRQCAGLVSLNSFKVRRAAQTVHAFARFRAAYEDRLPKGESFEDDDQAYFAALLELGQPRDAFGFGWDDLWLGPEMEEVLFKWAFSKPRNRRDEPNRNVIAVPDDFRTWARIARYDERMHTRFAAQLDVRQPEKARPVGEIESDWLTHRSDATPLETMRSLVRTLKNMAVETIRAHHQEIRVSVDELAALLKEYQAILEAIESERPGRYTKH